MNYVKKLKNDIINVQVNPKDKIKATNLLKDLNRNLKQVIKRNDISFETTPSPELLEAIEEGENILNGKVKVKGYHNVRKMFDDILNED